MGMDEGAHLVSGLRGQQRRSIAGAFEVLPVRVTPKRRGEPKKLYGLNLRSKAWNRFFTCLVHDQMRCCRETR